MQVQVPASSGGGGGGGSNGKRLAKIIVPSVVGGLIVIAALLACLLVCFPFRKPCSAILLPASMTLPHILCSLFIAAVLACGEKKP